MKLPDITLFFQIINFLLAYWVLRRFIFVPALKLIHTQERTNHLLNDKVATARVDLENNLEQKNKRWSFIKKSLIDMAPVVNLQKCLIKIKVMSPVKFSKIKVSDKERKTVQKMLHDKLLDIS